MSLGYYVKRTDTGTPGYYVGWDKPRSDGMALIDWPDGFSSLISTKYLVDLFEPVAEHSITGYACVGLGGRCTGRHVHQCRCGWRSVAHVGTDPDGCKYVFHGAAQ